MSGIRQHYIPQALLRSFGKRGTGKALLITVYPRDRGSFTTSTGNAALQRYFYSRPSAHSGMDSLDDRITAYETTLNASLVAMQNSRFGEAVEPRMAADTVTHLSIRNANIRELIGSAAGKLAAGAAEIFTNREQARRKFGLDLATPEGIIKREIHKLYEKFRPELKHAGINRSEFEWLAFGKMKDDFDQNFADKSHLINYIFGYLQHEKGNIAKRAHTKALGRSLVPEARADELRNLVWKIEPAPSEGIVLPDCIAVSFSADTDCLPLLLTNKDDVNIILMPLSRDRVLVGARAGAISTFPTKINEKLAICSWDFFIASDRTPELELLVPTIGTLPTKLLDTAIQDAFEEFAQISSTH